MKKLRVLHVYLGCIFAPMLMFFAISGIWQTLGIGHSGLLAVLSTAHVNSHLKSGVTLSSSVLRAFSILMALGFIVSAVLVIILAFTQSANRRGSYCSLRQKHQTT